ncbi:MAG TPA: hypothetical protein VFN34_03275 [Ornithinibacter sp.]|nr:hypothetical protein [Ornithinibacter sp.]
MSTSADLLVARADYDRRLELAGVDPYGRRTTADRRLDHGRRAARQPVAGHPLALFVARLVGRAADAGARDARRGPVVSGRPRHP